MDVATCPSSYDWADNSSGNDPCFVASILINVCNPSAPRLKPIGVGQLYPQPLANEGNKCTCSSVVYTLVAACADCQGASYDLWSGWSANCASTSEGFIPVGIPQGAETPDWVYEPSMYNPGYDPSVAYKNAARKNGNGSSKYNQYTSSPLSRTGLPQGASQTPYPGNSDASVTSPKTSTPTNSQSRTVSTKVITMTSVASDGATTIIISTSSTTLLVDPTPSAGDALSTPPPIVTSITSTNPFSADTTDTAGGSQVNMSPTGGISTRSSNAGPIAGGIIGGLAFLLIVGLVLRWYINRRRKKRMAPSTAFMEEYGRDRPVSWLPQNNSTTYLTWQRSSGDEETTSVREGFTARVR